MVRSTLQKGAQLNGVGIASRCNTLASPSRLNAVPKKLNTLDKDWTKRFIGYGIFSEDAEDSAVNIFERLEKKKVLSGVESAGLLSAADKAGLTLGKIEELGLLSTAENLGVLSLLEKGLTADPGKITSLSIPFFVATIAALVVIPSDNFLEAIIRYSISGGLGVGFLVLFVTGFLSASLQEEE